MVYKCIKGFTVDLVDENELRIENEVMHIQEGTLWEKNENCDYALILYRIDGEPNSYSWIDIDEEVLSECFEVVE